MNPLPPGTTSIPVKQWITGAVEGRAWARRWVRQSITAGTPPYEVRRAAAECLGFSVGTYGVVDAEWLYAYVLASRFVTYSLYTAAS